MFRFRVVDRRDVPWQALDRFDDRVVFQTREWLNFIAESQRATPVVAEIRDDDTVAGYFSGLVVRKFGVRILGSSELRMFHCCPRPPRAGRLVLTV